MAFAMRLFALLLVLAGCGTGRTELRPPSEHADPPDSVRLTLVTFNVQDLFVARDRRKRMRAIGRELGRLRPDYIALQEAFSASHRAELEAELERVAGVAYESVYFPSGVAGSGLQVLTRHRIERAVFWRYSKNGAWYSVKHGDWYVGKGVAMVRIGIEGVGSLDLFNTHCIANYLDAAYREDRTVQIEELMRFVEAEATTPGPAFLLGDLNAASADPEFAPVAGTFENLVLTMSPRERSRIDHIMVRPHAGFVVSAREFMELRSGTDEAGKKLRLSDHAGLVLTVRIEKIEGD